MTILEVLSSYFPFERLKISFFLLGSIELSKYTLPKQKPIGMNVRSETTRFHRILGSDSSKIILFFSLLMYYFIYHLIISERAISDCKFMRHLKYNQRMKNTLPGLTVFGTLQDLLFFQKN